MKQNCSRRKSSRQACGVNCGNRVLKGPHHDSKDSVEADLLLTWLHWQIGALICLKLGALIFSQGNLGLKRRSEAMWEAGERKWLPSGLSSPVPLWCLSLFSVSADALIGRKTKSIPSPCSDTIRVPWSTYKGGLEMLLYEGLLEVEDSILWEMWRDKTKIGQNMSFKVRQTWLKSCAGSWVNFCVLFSSRTNHVLVVPS